MSTDRYQYLRKPDGTMQDMPKVIISNRTTDIFVTYDSSKTRLDRISASSYDDDTYGWLILLANPSYSMEFDIPTGTVIRVPLPLKDAIQEYQSTILSTKNK